MEAQQEGQETPPLEQGEEPEEPVTMTTVPTTTTTVTIGGVTYTVNAVATAMTTGSMTVFKKEKRAALSEEKRARHFENATAKQQTDKFKMLSLSVANEENLNETYNLQMCVEEARQNMERYDMTDVFTILKFDENKQVQGAHGSLWDQYVLITADEIAKSNAYYATRIDETAHPYLRENLTLTFEYLKNNVEPDLF